MPQMINDHSSWVGKGSNGKVYPDGAKTKTMTSATGAGKMSEYEDTSEKIKSQQEAGVSKIKSHPRKAGTRN